MQSPVRTNDLLNAGRYLAHATDRQLIEAAFPGLQSKQPLSDAVHAQLSIDVATDTQSFSNATFLAGNEYYAAKDQLIMDEQTLLRVVGFDIHVIHPHRFLLNMCHVLRCSQQLTQLALCLVSRSHFISFCYIANPYRR